MSRIACAILAAGASRRLGHPKQLLLHRGRPLVLAAAECACQSRAAACAVVVGVHAEAVRAALGDLALEVLDNPDWSEGVASSIRTATAWAMRQHCQGLLIGLCDQPKLSAVHLDRLIAESDGGRLTVASYYAEKNAVPALFSESWFGDLLQLHGDSGAGALLNGGLRVSNVPWPDGQFDVDTSEAARRLQDKLG